MSVDIFHNPAPFWKTKIFLTSFHSFYFSPLLFWALNKGPYKCHTQLSQSEWILWSPWHKHAQENAEKTLLLLPILKGQSDGSSFRFSRFWFLSWWTLSCSTNTSLSSTRSCKKCSTSLTGDLFSALLIGTYEASFVSSDHKRGGVRVKVVQPTKLVTPSFSKSAFENNRFGNLSESPFIDHLCVNCFFESWLTRTYFNNFWIRNPYHTRYIKQERKSPYCSLKA